MANRYDWENMSTDELRREKTRHKAIIRRRSVRIQEMALERSNSTYFVGQIETEIQKRKGNQKA